MTNEEKLHNIEYLREKANVSYEEAENLLDQFDGNVMRALVELERQGRVHAQSSAESAPGQREFDEAKEKATSFLNKAFQTKVVIEKKHEDGEKETIVNLNAPFVAIAAVTAPWLAVASGVVAFATGHSIKIKKEESPKEKK